MRCDGVKPACQQCARAKKADACEYDDGKGKTRTQILRETISKLEQRVRELEDPDYISSNVPLFHPGPQHLGHSRSNSSCSSFESLSPYLSAPHSPFPSEPSPASPHGSWSQLQGLPSPSPSHFSPEIVFDAPTTHLQPGTDLAQTLIDIFTPHARQCGLQIHLGRLRESVTLPLNEQRHPVLMNTIYLWACFVSRPEPLSEHEDHYLQQALNALPDALRVSDRLIDLIQASCLLSLYFLANGRLLEGSYHASAAASLSLQISLHKGIIAGSQSNNAMEDLKPQKSNIEDGERILTFWQVYNLDLCWSVVLHRPRVIQDPFDSPHSVMSPWPQDIKDYESGHYTVPSLSPVIQAFLAGHSHPNSYTTPASRVKASSLFAHADGLCGDWVPSKKPTPEFVKQLQVLDNTISMFISTLPSVPFDMGSSDDKYSLIVSHTLGHVAMIYLHRAFSLNESSSFEKCSHAARACVSIIKGLTQQDYLFLEPVMGPCWWSVADVLIRELDAVEAPWTLVDSSELRHELEVLLYAMTTLSTRFPVVVPAVAKVQKRLAIN